MADPVRVRRLTEDEGRRLRRALVIMASASGNTVPRFARLVQGDEDAIREMIHQFDEIGLACLDSRWAGGRPRRFSEDDETFILATAAPDLSRERLREFLHHHKISTGSIC